MINRDENGKIVSADSISDVTKELSQIEKLLKSHIEKMSDEEKKNMVSRMEDLKVLMELVTPEMQKKSNPIELMGFLRQVMKIKTVAEKFQKEYGVE